MGAAPSSTFYGVKFLGHYPIPFSKGRKARKINSTALSPADSLRDSTPNRINHSDLIQQAMNDDPNAQAQLFTIHAAQLYRRAYCVLRNREDAEDALQDCWLRALTNLHTFGGRSSFSTWITRIVINSALMILRKKRNLRELSFDALDDSVKVSLLSQPSSAFPNPEESFVEHEEKKILDNAISDLRPRIRAVVELGQMRDLTTSETAHVLGISMSAAKGRLFHARAALRKSLALKARGQGRTEPAMSVRQQLEASGKVRASKTINWNENPQGVQQ